MKTLINWKGFPRWEIDAQRYSGTRLCIFHNGVVTSVIRDENLMSSGLSNKKILSEDLG